MKRVAVLAVLLLCRLAFADFSAVPVDQWRVVAKEGDRAALSDAQGTLRIDVDLDVRNRVVVGHITYNEATARVLLKTPVRLAGDQRRVLFEAAGMKKTIEKGSFLQLLPLIQDASGEVLRYEPYPCPHLLSGTDKWGYWSTRYLYGAEAGGATQNIFLSDANGDANGWPDGELTFLGFEVQIHPPAPGRQAHTLYVGDVGFGGEVIPYADPFLFADALVKTQGKYRFAAEVCGMFQGPPLRQIETAFAFDPASQADRRRRVVIPLGADGAYWIRYQVTDEQGAQVAADTLRQNVDGRPDGERLEPVPATEPPVIGRARINPVRHVGGVYETDAPLDADVRLFAKGRRTLTVKWRLMPYGFNTVIEAGERPVAFEAAPFADLTLSLRGEPGRDAYRLQLDVLDGQTVVESREYVLGRKTDLSKPRTTRQGTLRGRQYVKRSAYFRTTFNDEQTKTEQEADDLFVRYLDNASQITPYVTVSIDLADFEVLPGVYDFSMLDRRMDEASDRGCAITVRLVHVDQKAQFRWLPYSRQLSYDGTEIVQHYYGCYSGVDPVFIAMWKRANRALFDRYRAHPAFQGYYLMMPGGEWSIMTDKPWIGVLAGYETPARRAFVDFLKEEMKLDLAGLNKRWGTRYADWNAVRPPRPVWETGTLPDTRLEWLDFCRFKEFVNTRFWYLALARDIRSYDTDRVVIIYAPPSLEGLETLIDYTHGGGVPSMPGAGEGEAVWLKHGVGSIQESHHPHRWNSYGDPGGAGWVLDWDLYTMVSACGGGGANLHIYYYPVSPLLALYGAEHAYDRYEKFKPIFREMQQTTLVLPRVRQVATYQDPSSIYCKHRTNFCFRLPDLSRWFELLTYAGISHERLARERLGNYRLVLPNLIDEVVSKDTIDLLDGYVRGGGKAVITAVVGRYCPELGGESFPLLRRLGIAPPERPFVKTGLDVRAKASEGSAFFDAGQTIPFFTTQNLREDPQRDENVRANFFKWPYRWIPQTDYFGYYPGHEAADGRVLARFDEGGAAVSLHKVGKGEVVVFWGTPDYKPALMLGFVRRAADWAGVADPGKDSPIPLTFEAENKALKRHYVILWQSRAGSYTQKIPNAPDGRWWIDDLVSDEKLGFWTGRELREQGLPLDFRAGQSPLKVLRLMTSSAGWTKLYRQAKD